MAFVHGKDAEFELDANDLSAYINNTTFNPGSDSHDVTTYGQDGHRFASGLTNGTITIEGIYDSDGTGDPASVIYPMIGDGEKSFAYRPEGPVTGAPERTGMVVVTSYQETVPVAGMISWTANLQISGAVTDGDVV